MKKVASILLVFCLSVSLCSISASASDVRECQHYSECEHAENKEATEINQPPNDIFELEPYIYVDEDQHFQIREEDALLAGIDKNLIEEQKEAFISLNTMVDQNLIDINDDLSIDNNQVSILRYSYGHDSWCSGGYTSDVSYYWWGVSRTLCDCQTRFMANGYFGFSSVLTAAALFPGLHQIPAGGFAIYGSVLSNALNSANRGRGVKMNLTYALFFNVETL